MKNDPDEIYPLMHLFGKVCEVSFGIAQKDLTKNQLSPAHKSILKTETQVTPSPFIYDKWHKHNQ